MAELHWSKTIGNPFLIRVTPKASANRIKVETLADGSTFIRVYVTTVPEAGKANQAVLKLLAKEMGVPKSSLSIVRGETDRNKLIKLDK
ncbi:MAG: DUF167 domain-containing protein [Hyphomicrobiales bacterium]